MKRLLADIDSVVGAALRWISVGCMVLLLMVLSGVVFIRFVPIATLSWSDEIIEWAFAWMVFIGAAALWRENEHFYVEALEKRLEGRVSGMVLRFFVQAASIVFFVFFTYFSLSLTLKANDRSPMLEWSRRLWYFSMPLAGSIMVLYSFRNIIRLICRGKTGRGED